MPIVSASMTAGGSGGLGDTPPARDIEAAMSAAVEQAAKDGVADPEEIRRLMQEARAQIKREWRERANAAE